MANIVFAFLLLLLLFVLGSYYISKLDFRTNKIWITVYTVAMKLAKDHKEMTKAFRFAKGDTRILEEDSPFVAEAKKEFGGGFIPWLESDELAVGDIPMAVFKTLMHGYGFMAYLDHKDMTDAKQSLPAYNRILPANGFESLPKDRIENDIKTINAVEDVPTRTNNIVRQLNQYADEQGGKILWLDENGDSYAFFVVFPALFMQLQNTRLDDNHVLEAKPRI